MARKFVYWPERQRCHACRQYFGALVVMGLYCSYQCAGKPDPWRVPRSQWPRRHTLGSTQFPPRTKKVFLSLTEAQAFARANGKEAYLCDFCWMWHVGTPSVLTKTLVT